MAELSSITKANNPLRRLTLPHRVNDAGLELLRGMTRCGGLPAFARTGRGVLCRTPVTDRSRVCPGEGPDMPDERPLSSGLRLARYLHCDL